MRNTTPDDDKKHSQRQTSFDIHVQVTVSKVVTSHHPSGIRPIECEETLGHSHHAQLRDDAEPTQRRDTECSIDSLLAHISGIRYVSAQQQNTEGNIGSPTRCTRLSGHQIHTTCTLRQKVYRTKLQPPEKPRTSTFTCDPDNELSSV